MTTMLNKPCVRRPGRRRTQGGRILDWGYSGAPSYFAGSSSAFFAQSSQQTVISLPATLTLIPPSLMSQSHTGHLLVFIVYLLGKQLVTRTVNRLTRCDPDGLPESC